MICGSTPCLSKCPNYYPPKSRYYCSVCGEGIYAGEEYVKNQDDEYAHYDCFYSTKELLEWAGCEIKFMEENYD